MSCKYPIVLAHGIILKDIKFVKAFGRIEKILKKEGYTVSTAKTDGFGTIEGNAEQLKAYVENILAETGAEKVNIIAHSKGGLDAKYMIERLGMEDKVASLTTLCTPHKGSATATKLLKLPKVVKAVVAFWINTVYRIFGDKKPDALAVCRQLQSTGDAAAETVNFSGKVFCQSYSATLKRARDDFVLGIPYAFTMRFENCVSDGLVSAESSRFGEYMGDCLTESVSHSEIVDFMAGKKKREKIYGFYLKLCKSLADMGF